MPASQRKRVTASRPIRIGSAACATVFAAVALAASDANPDTYPIKPIRLIVPLAPGSTADIGARVVAEELARAIGQPVVVWNRPGAGGLIGTTELARAVPDGYTIGLASQGTLVFGPTLVARPGYDSLRDFAPIAVFARAANVLVVHPRNPARTPADIVAVAKSTPATLTYASGGRGTSHHLSGVMFGRATGVELVHVPYTSAPAGVRAVLTNEVTMGFFNAPMVLTHVLEGRLKALGVTGLTRLPLLPDVPTLDEQGVPGHEMAAWAGFVAPVGTPPAIVGRLNAELTKVLASAATRRRLVALGFEPSLPTTPAEFGVMISRDLATWAPVVKSTGASAE